MLCLCVLPSLAQKLSLKRYDVADGLANSIVTSIYQDKKGFIWFGTWEGLSRFDGYVFVNYGVRDGLGQQIVNDVKEDKQGRLWVATNGGGVSMLIEPQMPNAKGLNVKAKEKFISFRVSDKKESNQVNRIHFDSNNNLWCLTDFGLYRASLSDIAHLKFEPILEKKSQESSSLIEDSRGHIWCGLDYELFEIKDQQIIGHGSSSESVSVSMEDSGENSNFITGIVETKDGRLLVSTLIAFYELSSTIKTNGRARWLKQPLSLNNQMIYKMFEDSSGGLWFSVYGKYSNVFKYQNTEQNPVLKLQGVAYTFKVIAEDSEGNLWFGTHGSGIYKFGGDTFISYTNPIDSSPLIVADVFENYEGKIFGVLSDKSFVELTENEVRPSAKIDYIPSLSNISIIRSEKGVLYWNSGGWYPTVINQAFIQLRNGQIIHLKKFFTDSDLSEAIYFYEDENGSLWFVKENKEIYRLDTRTNSTLTHIVSVKDFVFRGPDSRIISDRVGGLWFSDRINLCRLREKQFKCLQPADGLPAIEPRSLFVDSRGWFWVGSRYNGVSVTKNPQDDEPQFINYAAELPSNTVWAVTEDEFGKMYFGTERGVAQFDVQKNLWRNFNSKNGLSGDLIIALTKDSKGNIWISTYSGLTKFNPKAERRADKPLPIYLNRVNIAGEDLPMAVGTSEIPLIELQSSRNNLTIEFVGLNYLGEDNLNYQYKLEGSDDDWSAPTKQRVVNYARLSSGNYRFLVRAVNREGVVSITPASFEFRIMPPIYQRWWFITLCVLVIGSMIVAIYRYRVARLLEMANMRTRIATDLHDDIGANLTRIALLSEVAKQQLNQNSKDENGNPLSSIARIARESVASMSDIVWAINPERDHLIDLVRKMRQHADEVFTLREIQLKFNAPDAETNLKLGVTARRDLLLIFKESVNNAARHSACTKVEIDFRVEDGKLSLMIKDDGKGFMPSFDGEGQGLRSMKRRAENLRGTLTIDSSNECGTTVKFVLSLSNVRSVL